ncbi:hypothetical protein [Kangiella profundi]|uniref:hypothetical protein n=1 Tax=Kangiella profundi TaxID=1561924 RepID=UPI0012FF27B6|nr:hypothetical protein [Kangiella profundi]GGF03811.1 hypothetical protein GCM10011356_16930 [Kangiella profundi]
MLPKRIALDEVQRLPELFVSIKQAVDEPRTIGRFVLTGLDNSLFLPGLLFSLASPNGLGTTDKTFRLLVSDA